MRTVAFLAAATVLLLGACGTVDMTPRAHPHGSVSGGGGSSAFVGAQRVRVAKGDTVYAISRRHRVPMRAIIESNDLKPPYTLYVGQRLDLPRVRVHEVARGDTLYAIARRNGTRIGAIASLNGLEAPYVIYPGQRLVLPGGWAPAPPREAPSARPRHGQKVEVATRRVVRPSTAPPPPPKATGRFEWPLRGRVLHTFGTKGKGLHNDGINIAAPRGTGVRAAENGVVVYAGNELKGFGNLLLIKHADGWVTAYAHNDRLLVARGARVTKGQKIAEVGSSGGVTEPQLHFELRRGKRAVDPLKHLPKAVASL